ncbi:Tellurite resistance protein (telA) [Candidatus Rhodobacter oscarellae]|uniref:Tellurite resistance protein (TelA) n=1 Tax=Candidatus Rhodobacter oscarellae TaxID=1675527 RepID=A0A0J9GYB5_9RHOB|nr:DUF2927 domain-containing protein [Candidatus Rhodobacter lobularis]KMW58468.1 Tellurite resistance protein (telA) [Candidatus Rhodobacter lobularis]
MRQRTLKNWSLGVAGALLLAACQPIGILDNAPPPQPGPEPEGPVVTEPSAASKSLEAYYGRIQQNFLTRGLLRVDGGGPDTPITRRQLVENFVRIALFEEFSSVGGRMVRSGKSTRLHRWAQPIRMQIVFGDSVPLAKRARDRREIYAFARRMTRLTGLPVTVGAPDPNFFVFIVNEDERQVLGPKLREISPDVDSAAVDTVQDMRRSTLCLVFAVDGGENGIYSRAAAVIRAEHPDLLRLSCIHEEIAQGLGLPNDSPLARPSVFNDDEEFGLLTTHDEYLLRMLYDPRMRPGMTEAEARPIAEQIALELLGAES